LKTTTSPTGWRVIRIDSGRIAAKPSATASHGTPSMRAHAAAASAFIAL
jgi:hypothetical protein